VRVDGDRIVVERKTNVEAGKFQSEGKPSGSGESINGS
jgi:hypothetical protein